MLTSLDITNLSVIDSASIEPAPGLTAVTGETGAGKTLIVTGLGLLLGERADQGLVRSGAKRALVEGRFADLDAVSQAVVDLGTELDGTDPPELLASRQIQASGRSRGTLGGAQVPLGALHDVVGELVAIHGQSGQMKLAEASRQRELLDEFGGAELAGVLQQYRTGFAERAQLQTQLDELVHNARERARELDLLKFGLGEIEAVDPQPGEDDVLAAEAAKLQAVDDLRLLARQAGEAVSGSEDGDPDNPGAVGLIGAARKALLQLSELDAATSDLLNRTQNIQEQVNDLAVELSDYLDGLEADPLRLETITARRAELAGLTRKYGETIDDVLEWARSAGQRVLELENSDERITQIQQRITDLDGQLVEQAQVLTGLRSQGAEQFAARVQLELAALAMPHAQLRFELAELPSLGPWGAESVQLLFTANPGSKPAPLGKVASGGELSRVRLAIEVVLGDTAADTRKSAPRQTVVFDEVDAGVGGAVGLEIGRRLARLAQSSQVLVVTHLAQVAAFADRQFVVRKADDGQVTTSGVVEVTGSERISEIARMMGGLSNEAGFSHAEALLREAGQA
jgi:DNA repair protein RecN (Recombination protein N)